MYIDHYGLANPPSKAIITSRSQHSKPKIWVSRYRRNANKNDQKAAKNVQILQPCRKSLRVRSLGKVLSIDTTKLINNQVVQTVD